MAELVLRAAVVQPEITDETEAERVERIVRLLRGAGEADLIVLPELWRIGILRPAAIEPDAELLDGPSLAAIRAAAPRSAYVLAGSLLERRGDGLFNTAVLLAPGGAVAGVYRKRHLLAYRSPERARLTPGAEDAIVRTRWGAVGIAICYDLRFPEGFRRMTEAGAEIFLVPAAWPSDRAEAWDALTRARAVENQAALIAAGSAGRSLLGHSRIVDPHGGVTASLGGEEGILRGEIDLGALRGFREAFTAWKER